MENPSNEKGGFRGVLSGAARFAVKNRAYLLAFFIPAALLFISYMLFGVYPAGKRSVLALDLNAQYVYYYDYMYDVFAGRESLFYCWSRTLSGEFFGILAYYLASPFNLIVWLFPRTAITEGLLTMLLFKAAAGGLTCCFLLRRQRGYSELASVVFSLSYALSGYFAAHSINPMWLDGMIVLPLVIIGVEKVCDKKRFLLYTLSLLYIFIANYYIGYMVGIFSLLYFVYYIASGRTNARGAFSVFKSAALYVCASLAAIFMSGFVVLPVYRSLKMGKLQMGDPDLSLVENFNMTDSFLKLFCGTFDTIRPEGFPMIFCGTVALVFAAVYFVTRKIPLRQRVAGGALLGVMLLSMYIKPADMFWHGGRVPVWMPYRYSFTVVFLLIIFGAEAFENIKSVRRKAIGGVFAAFAAVLLIADHYAGSDHYNTQLVIVIPLLTLAIASGAAVMYKHFHEHRAMKISLLSLVGIELVLNNLITFDIMDKDIVYSSRESYLSDIPRTREAANAVKEYDDGFYRMEKTYHRCVNDPMAAGMYGFSHSTSTFNEKAIALVRKLGFGAREHYSRYDGATRLTDDIFGVKYVLSKNDLLSQYDESLPIDTDSGIKIYENPDAFGIAFAAEPTAAGAELEGTPFEAQERLAYLLSGENEQIFVPIYNFSAEPSNLNVGATTDNHISYKKRLEKEQASLTYRVTPERDGCVYMYLPTAYERECWLYVDDTYIRNYFENENHCIAFLGNRKQGETFYVKLTLTKNDMYFEQPLFRSLDEEALGRFTGKMASLNENTEVRLSDSHTAVTVNVDCAAPRTLFTTIPYEEGWTAVIDGEEAEIGVTADGTLMCLELPEGQHTVVFSFRTAGLKTGLLFSAGGLAMFAVMITVNAALTRRRKTTEN